MAGLPAGGRHTSVVSPSAAGAAPRGAKLQCEALAAHRLLRILGPTGLTSPLKRRLRLGAAPDLVQTLMSTASLLVCLVGWPLSARRPEPSHPAGPHGRLGAQQRWGAGALDGGLCRGPPEARPPAPGLPGPQATRQRPRGGPRQALLLPGLEAIPWRCALRQSLEEPPVRSTSLGTWACSSSASYMPWACRSSFPIGPGCARSSNAPRRTHMIHHEMELWLKTST